MKLTPEDLQRIEDKKVANILRKIYTEKRTPTAREDAILQRAGLVPEPPASGFAKNWDALAVVLRTTRRSLQEWRKDPRYEPDCPRAASDGRLDVAAFAAWMVKHDLKRAAQAVDDRSIGDEEDGADIIHPPRLSGSQADWRKVEICKKVERQDIELEKIRGTLLIAAELEVPLGATFAAIQNRLSTFPPRVARYLVGMRDAGEIEDKLRDELDADLGELHAAAFVETSIESVLASLPFDEESTRLLKLVTFAQQDATALRELIARVAVQALRLIGRQSITSSESTAADQTPAVSAAPAASAATHAPPEMPPKPPAEKAPKTKTKRKRKPRPQPAKATPEVEAAISAAPRAKTPRRARAR